MSLRSLKLDFWRIVHNLQKCCLFWSELRLLPPFGTPIERKIRVTSIATLFLQAKKCNSSTDKFKTWSQPKTTFSITEHKSQGSKIHKQAASEGGCNEGLAENLQGLNSQFIECHLVTLFLFGNPSLLNIIQMIQHFYPKYFFTWVQVSFRSVLNKCVWVEHRAAR